MAFGSVQIGIAGWSYPDWRGRVYPRGCKDELRFLARYVDFIEINTTFYRVPEAELVAGWCERTQDLGTRFTAKVPRSITHERVVDRATIDAFRASLEPLRDADRLMAVLAQFNFRFRADEPAFELLHSIASELGDCAPLVLEVRDGSWRDPGAQRRVADLGFEIAHLDYAVTESGYDGRDVRPSSLAYFRIHGRNRDAWYSKDADRDDVYDYAYSGSERRELAEHIGVLAPVADTLVVTNNHFHGKALKLALELRADLSGAKVDVPDPLLAAFPELRNIARGVLF